MKLKDRLIIRKIADEYIMISDSGTSLDYTKAISLNESAVFLIEAVKDQEFDLEYWAELLVQRYEISKEQALEDAQALIEALDAAGILD
ncbi:PqqD family protein [Porphyromonas sp. COT-239 OH1446]|uniref:PqqD family protein n=1 Tax=Porphyromonas sp. COT-239 OH1446 TaxID=1515613 RepID=UPI00052DBA6F|nr:PqqD family protein [Porphyromonas sp. COT-239 OH1446]KGN68482.1 hypothetical protein HQ37_05815 [Porphyromonas sp. COT-239 OH1446]